MASALGVPQLLAACMASARRPQGSACVIPIPALGVSSLGPLAPFVLMDTEEERVRSSAVRVAPLGPAGWVASAMQSTGGHFARLNATSTTTGACAPVMVRVTVAPQPAQAFAFVSKATSLRSAMWLVALRFVRRRTDLPIPSATPPLVHVNASMTASGTSLAQPATSVPMATGEANAVSPAHAVVTECALVTRRRVPATLTIPTATGPVTTVMSVRRRSWVLDASAPTCGSRITASPPRRQFPLVSLLVPPVEIPDSLLRSTP